MTLTVETVRELPKQDQSPKNTHLDFLAKYGPGPSAEEIDENRREIFRGFGEDFE
jgi:hypothetical protein